MLELTGMPDGDMAAPTPKPKPKPIRGGSDCIQRCALTRCVTWSDLTLARSLQTQPPTIRCLFRRPSQRRRRLPCRTAPARAHRKVPQPALRRRSCSDRRARACFSPHPLRSRPSKYHALVGGGPWGVRAFLLHHVGAPAGAGKGKLVPPWPAPTPAVPLRHLPERDVPDGACSAAWDAVPGGAMYRSSRQERDLPQYPGPVCPGQDGLADGRGAGGASDG